MRYPTKRVVVAAAFAASALSGCYVVPIAPEAAYPSAVYPAVVVPPGPAVLQARLYPANEVASRTGMLAGTVTNMMTGKGRFQLDYAGELLVGEATRVAGDDHGGLANAYGPRGTYMNCRYRMSTPYQGIGTCDVSTGARYQVHIGA
jgi:hypothetical protein